MADKSSSGEKTPQTEAASPTGSMSGSGSWWGSWLDTAKTRSASVLEAVKNDLTELTTAVKTEATSATEAIGRSLSLSEPDSAVGAMKKSFSSFLGQVSEALVPSLEEEEEGIDVLITHEGADDLTGFHRHLAELQSLETTYLEEPSDELSEKYKRWMEVVEQEQFTEPRLARHLANSAILNDQYCALVPGRVAHMDFWKRYLFKKALLEDAVANADLAERKAKAAVAGNETVAPSKVIVQTDQPKRTIEEEVIPDDIAWAEVPEFDASNMELSEEEQARLLEEYEQEIKEREKAIVAGQIDLDNESLLVQPDRDRSPQKKQSSAIPSSKIGGSSTTTKKPQSQPQSAKSRNNNQKNQQQSGNAGRTVGNAGKQKASNNSTQQGQKQKGDLKIEKDHFTKDEVSSSNSDESWEKEFDLE
ncbi:BSD domain-containing protein 1-like [Sabethes cyaneus]|uniref:BSD domain-containing protein 1-like n=1 Tax=Sabethes cyaneus TaxID=53552 RepID=UPI00221E377E|nr:BSD domain-containing protein 1-like [Sabethes cyaneus]XP_053684602.1 BSD domain-containing protein 1-like [Sabethes cyaneus]